MGAFMKQQIEEKLAEGFTCVKLKIGAIDFDKELDLLRYIRQHFTPEQVEIRVDANGAFDLNEALNKITQLSEFKLHSIEQPIQKTILTGWQTCVKLLLYPLLLTRSYWGVWKIKNDYYKRQCRNTSF
jgi:L-alanine-DL-glutamate epimerase-like enolase superfamily enzyme